MEIVVISVIAPAFFTARPLPTSDPAFDGSTIVMRSHAAGYVYWIAVVPPAEV
jgi:hypothetical protein